MMLIFQPQKPSGFFLAINGWNDLKNRPDLTLKPTNPDSLNSQTKWLACHPEPPRFVAVPWTI